MKFIRVNSNEGEVWINADNIEMLIPKTNAEDSGTTVRMSEKFFLSVRESVKELLELMNA